MWMWMWRPNGRQGDGDGQKEGGRPTDELWWPIAKLMEFGYSSSERSDGGEQGARTGDR